MSVDKIVMHQKYHNFQHDLGKMLNVNFSKTIFINIQEVVMYITIKFLILKLDFPVLMRLSRPANITRESYIRKICLPFITNQQTVDANQDEHFDPLYAASSPDNLNDYQENNYLRKMRWTSSNETVNLKDIISKQFINYLTRSDRKLKNRRRNDKFFHEKPTFDRKSDNAYDFLLKKGSTRAPPIENKKSGEVRETFFILL